MKRPQLFLGTIALISFLLLVGCAGSMPPGAGGSGPQGATLNQQAAPVSTPSSVDAVKPGSGSPATSASSAAGNWVEKAGDLQVALKMTPYPPSGRNQNSFEITITDATGKPVTDAQVSLDLTMPDMWMPPNKPTAQAVGDGLYTASARMMMRGEWQIAVIIRRGGQEQRANFYTEVR